ncbi:MAG: hypothetical protein WA989_12035 [Henriciella sp.]|uniref:hypothetical protein n=1 Tax=Henriciella sp. TaxID=1968823 RepID=UPI003C728F22
MAEKIRKQDLHRAEERKSSFTLLSAWIGLLFVIFCFVLSKEIEKPVGDASVSFVYVVGGIAGILWMMLPFVRLSAIWPIHSDALTTPYRERSDEQKRVVKLGFVEFFFYLLGSLSLLGLIAYRSSVAGGVGPVAVQIAGPDVDLVHVATFLAGFVAAFAPIVLLSVRHAKLEAYVREMEGSNPDILRDDVVSEFSFWTTFIIIAALVGLAWAAAGNMFRMEDNFGVFVTFLVLLAFLTIILAPHVLRVLNDWRERQFEKVEIADPKPMGLALNRPGILMSRLDSVLVRYVAPLSGATRMGGNLIPPHVLVLFVIVPLSALGYMLSAPWGLIPIAVAILIAASLGRRWAWVEEDRETASRIHSTRGKEISIGFDNDLKDEALLGYASFFILVPLALHQLQGWTESFHFNADYSTNNPFLDWLRFFGAELAKAVPFVDWWEIYNVDIEAPYDAAMSSDPLAKHLTFAARAMVDLVIMAALFQAISLWQRSRSQNRLYDGGQLDTLDPFTEIGFFERGMWQPKGPDHAGRYEPKKRFVKRVREHIQQRRDLGLDGLPYNQKRLSELLHHPNEDVRYGARWMIDEFEVLAGTAQEQLDQLCRRLGEERFERALNSNDRDDVFYLREQRAQLERILLEFEREPWMFADKQVSVLVKILKTVENEPEFTSAEVTAVTLFKKQLSELSLLALFNLVLEKDHRQSPRGRPYHLDLVEAFGANSDLFAGLAPMREDVYEAIEFHGLSPKTPDARRKQIVDVLKWMGQSEANAFGPRGDRARPSRERAARAALCVSLFAHGI